MAQSLLNTKENKNKSREHLLTHLMEGEGWGGRGRGAERASERGAQIQRARLLATGHTPDELCSSGMFFRARLHLLLSNGEAAEG